jgi:hypothetical protein
MDLETMVKTYIITTAQYNSGVNKELLRNIEKYASVNNGKILVLPTTGKNITEEEILAKELQQYSLISKDYNINKSLRIRDFGVRPQQINPLTGLERFAQGDKSYILPSTKQVLKFVANSYDEIPKAVMTTGAITNPNYNLRHRMGRIAQQDHEYGFLVVEKVNNKYFHFRHIKSLKNGSFSDITGEYKNGKHFKNPHTKALVVGDLHPYDLDPIHKEVTMEQIKILKPDSIFLHDTFNGKSISHHYEKHNIRKFEVYNEQGLNLEAELKQTYKEISDYCNAMGNGKVYVVASNHDEHLYKYLDEGRFIGDKGNDLMASRIYTRVLCGEDALKSGLELIGKLPSNLVFISRDNGFKVLGYELGHHGDLGANGGRGSPRSIENANSKSITGHGHSAFKIRDTYRVGTSTKLRLDYNRGYSNWTQTNAVLYGNGSVQLLNTIKGSWRLER